MVTGWGVAKKYRMRIKSQTMYALTGKSRGIRIDLLCMRWLGM